MTTLTEADVEQVALDWLASLGWQVAHGPDIAPDTPRAECGDYGQTVLERRLRDALAGLNPSLPASALDDAFRKLTRPEGATPEARNRAFHRMLVEGVTVEYRSYDEQIGGIRGAQVQVIDFDNPTNNDWLAVNQFTVTENKNTRRPDIVLFVNGLPLSVIELKNPTDEDATIWTAWQQLQTYKAELPTLFSMNEFLMVSDGIQARIGSLTAGREWFKPWRTISGESLADPHMTKLQVMLEGTCTQHRFLSLVRDFIVFEDDGSGALVKKMAGYHQFHAVQVAVTETLDSPLCLCRRTPDAGVRNGNETPPEGGSGPVGPHAHRLHSGHERRWSGGMDPIPPGPGRGRHAPGAADHLGGPTGSVEPSRLQLPVVWPQNVEVTYNAPNASGLIEQIVSFDSGHVDYDYNNVMIQGLSELTANAHLPQIIHHANIK